MENFVNGTNVITVHWENDSQIEANATENRTYYEIPADVHVFRKFLLIFWLCTIALCFTTVSFGIVSWALIAKWRQFRNYVSIMVCFSGGLFNIASTLTFISKTIMAFITMLGVSSFVFWLLITSVIFYVDVVRIFSYNYEHVYLKSAAFAWGIPALILVIDHLFYVDLTDLAMIGVSVVSVSLYIKVLYTLLRRRGVRGSSHMTSWKKIRVATFIFLGSGCAMMLPVLLVNHVDIGGVSLEIVVFMFLLQLIAINVLFLMLKSHRNLWIEYLQRRRDRNETLNSITSR